MSEERKKKSGAAWKAKEDEKLNKSRAFVEQRAVSGLLQHACFSSLLLFLIWM